MPFYIPNFLGGNQNLESKATGDTAQNVNIVDVICEGPVYGLVDGSAGVYLNDVAAEYAEFREFIPVQTDSSGTIVFTGSGDTIGSVDSNTTIPDDLENVPENPRALILSNYYQQEVTLAETSNTEFGRFFSLTATSGTPFTADWASNIKTTAILYQGDQIVKGVVFYNTTSQVNFQQSNTSNTDIDTSVNYTLRISKNFAITDIDSANSEISVATAPNAGTYNFGIGKLPTTADVGSAVLPWQRGNINKIKNLVVETRKGLKDQKPLSPVAGVGGSASIPGDIRKINLRQLKIVSLGVANAVGLTRFDPNGMPTNATDDVNEDVTLLPASAFGLDSNAKIAEVDEISWSIAYNAFQTINLKGGDKSTAYAFYAMQIRVERNGQFQDWFNAFPSYGEYIRHQGNTNAASQFEHVVNLEQYRPFTNFEVRIIRLSRHIGLPVEGDGSNGGETNKDDWQLAAQAQIVSTNAIIKDLFAYPYSALASVSFSSKQFDNVPKRSYLMRGLLVSVPSNYTPREYSSDGSAVYDGFWDGSFKTGYYTDNPAWVFYDILTNNRYGAGKWVDELDIDKYTLYRVARYCDELVPSGEKDGNGDDILEPRFRANIFLAKATDVYKVLKDMATVFLGIIYWQDGQLVAVQDTPQDPIYTFTKGNVIDGVFSYETTGTRTRTNQVIVTWNDPSVNFEPTPLLVEDRDAIVKTGRIISESAVAFGATSEGQALRYGKWKLWTAQNQTEIVSFKTSLAAQFIKPGDVINVQDADRYGVQLSGRLSASTSNSVTLDRTLDWGGASFPIGSDDEYELSVLITAPAAFWTGVEPVTIQGVTPDILSGGIVKQAYVPGFGLTNIDTEEKASSAFREAAFTTPLSLVWKEYSYVQTETITKPSSPTNQISIPGTFDVAPAASTVWALRATQGAAVVLGSAKEYKVLGISQSSPNEYEVSAVEFYNEKFIAVEQDYERGVIPDSVYPEIEPLTLPAPSNPRILLDTDAATEGEELFVVWDEPTTDTEYLANYEVHHNIEGLDSPLLVSDTKVYFANIPNGTLDVKIRAVSTKGNYSRYIGLTYRVDDPFASNVDRVQEGIPKGIISSSTFRATSANEIGFDKNPASVVSIGDSLDGAREITTADNIDISGLDTGTDYFVLLEDSTLELLYYDSESLQSTPYWRVIPDGGNKSSSQSANWTSIGSSVSAPENSNIVTGVGSSWTTTAALRDLVIFGSATDFSQYNVTGVSLVAGSAVEVSFSAPTNGLFTNGDRISLQGTGTGGLNGYYYINNVSATLNGPVYDYTVDLYLKPELIAANIFDPDTNDDNSVDLTYTSGGTIRNSPLAAKIISITNDNEIILNKTFEDEIPAGTTIRRRAYRPNFTNDAVFAKVSYDGSTYSILKYITLDQDLSTGKFVEVVPNVPILQYEAASPNAPINHPANISFSATAIGFVDPLFKVSALSSGLDSNNLDNDFQDPDTAGQFVYTKTVDTDGVGYNTGASETITVEVVERTNTTDIIEGVGQIVKTTAGADGATGTTAFLQAADYSVIYDEAGANPNYIGTGTVALTATAGNFDTPVYKFTLIGTNLNTPASFTITPSGTQEGATGFYDGNTSTIAIPAAWTAWNNTDKKTTALQVKVEIAESGDTATVLAFDIITIQGIHALKGGYWVSLSNESHTIPTTATGVPIGTPDINNDVVGVNSGTTIEVGKGSDILTFVAGTPGLGEFSVSAADVSGSSEITPSTPSGTNTTLATYPDHEFNTVNWTDDSAAINYTLDLESEETLVRTQTFSKSKKGFGGITVTNSNPVQALPADKAGNVLAYTDSGTEINVLIAGDSVPYHTDSHASTNNISTYWNISSTTPTNITLSGTVTPPTNGGTGPVVYGNHSAFDSAETNANIVYNIKVVVDDTVEALTTTQFFSKNTNGTAVFITASATHLNFDENQGNPSPPNYTINWSSIVPAGISAPAYKLVENGGTAVNYDGSTTTGSITPTYGSLPITYEVQLYESISYTTLLATDTVTVNKSKDGEPVTGQSSNIVFIRVPASEGTPVAATDGTESLPADWDPAPIGSGPVYAWSDSPPAANGDLLWASNGTKAVGASSWTWGSAYRVDSDLVREIFIYKKDAAAGSDPAGSTYNFTNKQVDLGTANGWQTSVPSITGPEQKIYQNVGLASGAIGETAAPISWGAAVLYAESAVSITSTSTANGVTTVNFSDGSSITIDDGNPGTSEGVLVVYADDASGTNKSFTRGSNQNYVLYYEWVGTRPTSVAGITGTWVKFTGDDGGGVIPVYSSVSNPTTLGQISLSAGTNQFVTFYEYTGAKPTSVITAMLNETYVPFIGKRSNTGTLYNTSNVAAPTGATYDFDNGTFGSLGTWTVAPPATVPGTQNDIYYVSYTVIETTAGGGSGTLTFGSVYKGITFDGVVRFVNSSGGAAEGLQDASGTVTTIDGGAITTNTIDANKLTIGTTGQGVSRMLLTNNSLKIFEGTNLRVHLGDLNDSTT